MKITFDIANEQDVVEAAGLMLALEEAFKLLSGELIAERPATEAAPATAVATPKRGRPKKTVEQPLVETAPISNGLAGTTVAEAYAASGDALNGQLPLFENEGIEAARDRLRTLAQEKGVTWLRPQLEARGVTRLSELSDGQVREFLHDQA
jgi:hypothetical protein